jgi:hypothetical protein
MWVMGVEVADDMFGLNPLEKFFPSAFAADWEVRRKTCELYSGVCKLLSTATISDIKISWYMHNQRDFIAKSRRLIR